MRRMLVFLALAVTSCASQPKLILVAPSTATPTPRNQPASIAVSEITWDELVADVVYLEENLPIDIIDADTGSGVVFFNIVMLIQANSLEQSWMLYRQTFEEPARRVLAHDGMRLRLIVSTIDGPVWGPEGPAMIYRAQAAFSFTRKQMHDLTDPWKDERRFIHPNQRYGIVMATVQSSMMFEEPMYLESQVDWRGFGTVPQQ